ncbi:HET-domain-containing protein, partial [Sarocladium strictum]
VVLPALSAALLMRFLLVPYKPTYIAQPLPLQPSNEPPKTPFCQICRDSFLKEIKRDSANGEGMGMKSFPHQRTIRSLRKSAVEGCRVCVTLWEKMCTVESDWGPSYLFFWDHATSWQSFGMGMLVFQSKWGGNLAQFGVMEVKDEKYAPCSSEDLEDSTGSEKSIVRAKGWLEKCVLDHEGCRGGRDGGFRPTRLLYLGDKSRISLQTRDDFPNTFSYVTLSHCWGGALFIQLQQNNVELFREEISWDSLPQTFKDAISVARRMGFKYLWIDSLCILQDSEQDWLTESKVMGDIYKNAVLNIAASNAQNSRQGCIYPRNPRTIQPELLPADSQYSASKSYLVNSPGIVQRFDQLYSRAWVLQESILARRTLDCARDQLFWRCDELVASEELPRGLPPVNLGTMCHPSRGIMGTHNEVSSIRSMIQNMKKWQVSNEKIMNSVKSELRGQDAAYLQENYGRSSPGGLWGSLVEIYSRMSFTYDSDRPVAISGIIKSFQPFLGEYWAGMWQDLIPGHLVWSIRSFSALYSTEPSPCYRPSVKRAPSWSWLSLEGPVHYREMSEYFPGMVLAQLLHVEVMTTCDVRLRIRAPMVHAKWKHESRDILASSLVAIGFKPIRPGLSIVDLHGTAKWQVSQHIQSFFKDTTCFIRLVFDVAEEGNTVRDVELVAIRTRHGMIEGLVLQESESGVFARVGRFYASQEGVTVFTKRHEREFVL